MSITDFKYYSFLIYFLVHTYLVKLTHNIMDDLLIALSNLSGVLGRDTYYTIIETGVFTETQYNVIVDDISFNRKESVCQYFGTVHYYYRKMNFN